MSGTHCSLLAFTNLARRVAPAMVKSKFKETAAQMMSLCLIAGLFVGSVVVRPSRLPRSPTPPC